MIYLGILFIITDYCPLKMKDIFYYSTIVICFSIAAYTVNSVLGSNLMFVSETFPGTAIDIVYSFSPALFPVLITFLQAVPPFIVIYGIIKLRNYIISKKHGEFIGELK